MPIYEIYADGEIEFTGTIKEIKDFYGIKNYKKEYLRISNSEIVTLSRLRMLENAIDIEDVIDIICKLWNNDYMAVRVG